MKKQPSIKSRIDQTILEKTVVYLREVGILDEEDIGYKLKNYPITHKEFIDLTNVLVDLAIQEEAIYEIPDEDGETGGLFGESRTSFRYQDVNFTLNTLFGQGSVTTLFEENYNPEYCPFSTDNVVDLNLILS